MPDRERLSKTKAWVGLTCQLSLPSVAVAEDLPLWAAEYGGVEDALPRHELVGHGDGFEGTNSTHPNQSKSKPGMYIIKAAAPISGDCPSPQFIYPCFECDSCDSTPAQYQISSGDIPNSMRCSFECSHHPAALAEPRGSLVEPSWNLTSGPPLSGLRPQSFQLLGKKNVCCPSSIHYFPMKL